MLFAQYLTLPTTLIMSLDSTNHIVLTIYIYIYILTHTYIYTYSHTHLQFTRSPFLNEEDRDDDEVITFEGNNPSSNLPRGMPRHTLSDDFENRKNKTSSDMIYSGKKSL